MELSATRINVDTACAYGGFLTAIELPSHRIYSVPRKTGLRPAFLRDKTSRRAAIRFLGSVPVTVNHERHGPLKLEPLNYSEIGMLLWSPEESERTTQLLEQGEAVNGTVGDGWQVPFSAKVVHSRKQSDGDIRPRGRSRGLKSRLRDELVLVASSRVGTGVNGPRVRL